MTEPLRLCWWEVDELLEHLRSRSDLWTQSNENPYLWLREDIRLDGETDAFALLFVPPTSDTSQFRSFLLQSLPLGWDDSYTSTYVSWLLGHWTSYTQRQTITKFLQDELKIDPATAPLAAIAVLGLTWDTSQTPEPSASPLQEELWPASPQPPSVSFSSDPTLIGTFLFNGDVGWLQLRLLGNMLRATLSMRSKDGLHTLPLQGFVRPMNGHVRDAAAQIAGWPSELAATCQDGSSQDNMIKHYDSLPEAN